MAASQPGLAERSTLSHSHLKDVLPLKAAPGSVPSSSPRRHRLHRAAQLQAGSSGRVNACSGTLNPVCPTPPLCQGPPRPPPCRFLPSWGCSVPIRPRRSTLPDAQRGPFCHREHRGSGLSPWKTGPQRPWPRRRNAWLGSSPMSMTLVLGIQRAARKRSLRGGERQTDSGCTLGSLLFDQPSPIP